MNDYPWRLQIIYSAVLSLILVLQVCYFITNCVIVKG